MAMGRKRKDSVEEDVEAYRHETEIRKNVVPIGIASYDTSKVYRREYLSLVDINNKKKRIERSIIYNS